MDSSGNRTSEIEQLFDVQLNVSVYSHIFSADFLLLSSQSQGFRKRGSPWLVFLLLLHVVVVYVVVDDVVVGGRGGTFLGGFLVGSTFTSLLLVVFRALA